MKSLKLTSPGVLVILAVLSAGGIFLLDLLYLQPYVGRQLDDALAEQSTRVVSAGRLALRTESETLTSACSVWAHNPELADLARRPDVLKRFENLTRAKLTAEDVHLAWITGPEGKVIAWWATKQWLNARPENEPPAEMLAEVSRPILADEPLAATAFVRMSNRVAICARRKIASTDGQGSAQMVLWVARDMDASTMERVGSAIGGTLVLVDTDTVPRGIFADRAITHACWPGSDGRLVVGWLAYDGAGKALGCFRAEVSASHIYRQATTSRRMILITLTLSSALVLLVILGTHILVAGPVLRLLRRLQRFESGGVQPRSLTDDMHGEPLVLARRLESAFDRLAYMSTTDQLTGLANRRHFEQVLERLYHQAKRYNRPLSVMVMDVDFFKAVNDTGGHKAGDELLKIVAGKIEQASRKVDLPGRLGGDEFAVLLPETDVTAASAVAERILQTVQAHQYNVDGVSHKVTVSIGLTDLNAEGMDSPDAMLSLADRALYAAKEAGRNRVAVAGELDSTARRIASESGGKVNTLSKKLAGLDNRFKNLFLQAIEEIMDVLEMRDRFMIDHARKVQRYAVLIANEMELPDRITKHIEIAAMLHDIGMLVMPDDILLCPHELSDPKLRMMQKHPLYSVRIMEGMAFLDQEIPAVKHHHEHYDGSGYPEGLQGGAIPLSARILAVADVFDALTSKRTFRGAMTQDEALDEMHRGAGKQFDPSVVEALLAAGKKLGSQLMIVPEDVEVDVTSTPTMTIRAAAAAGVTPAAQAEQVEQSNTA